MSFFNEITRILINPRPGVEGLVSMYMYALIFMILLFVGLEIIDYIK